MDNQYNDTKILDPIKQLPLELELDQVHKLISEMAHPQDVLESNHKTQNFISIKKIIMILTPLLIAVSILYSLIENNSTTEMQSERIEKEILIIEEAASLKEYEEVLIKKNTGEQTLYINSLSKLPTQRSYLSRVEERKEEIPLKNPLILAPENKQIIIPTRDEIKSFAPIARQADPFQTDIPDLNNFEMRRMKRRLYKKLIKDGYINAKGQFVRIQLPGDKIIINELSLDMEAMREYLPLITKAGVGPKREIEMCHQYIKIGDFNEEGFRGSGFGTFTATMDSDIPTGLFSDQKDMFDQSSIVDLELERLKVIGDSLIKLNLTTPSKQRLFDVNLSGSECHELHEAMLSLLLEDGLVTEENIYMVVDLSSNILLFNGKAIDEPLMERYIDLCDKFKIKLGQRRMIRLSAHTISIGEFDYFEFSGTRYIMEE